MARIAFICSVILVLFAVTHGRAPLDVNTDVGKYGVPLIALESDEMDGILLPSEKPAESTLIGLEKDDVTTVELEAIVDLIEGDDDDESDKPDLELDHPVKVLTFNSDSRQFLHADGERRSPFQITHRHPCRHHHRKHGHEEHEHEPDRDHEGHEHEHDHEHDHKGHEHEHEREHEHSHHHENEHGHYEEHEHEHEHSHHHENEHGHEEEHEHNHEHDHEGHEHEREREHEHGHHHENEHEHKHEHSNGNDMILSEDDINADPTTHNDEELEHFHGHEGHEHSYKNDMILATEDMDTNPMFHSDEDNEFHHHPQHHHHHHGRPWFPLTHEKDHDFHHHHHHMDHEEDEHMGSSFFKSFRKYLNHLF